MRHRVKVGDWQLDIDRNPFSGTIACRLRAANGRAFYEGGAVGFRFGTRTDVGDAIYRVDGGPPRAWRDDLPFLLAADTPIDTGGMANPTRGIVRVPWQRLADANSIAIQPRRDRHVRTFHFRGLKGLYDLGRERGCDPDARYVR